MSYLSHVPQHELRQRAGKTVDSPDDRHRDVMSLFPQMTEQERSDTRILFRLERLPGQAPAFLVRSPMLPSNPTPGTQARPEPTDAFAEGQRVSFRVALNGVERPRAGGIRPVGDMDEWTAEKLAPALADVTVLNHVREVVGADRRGRAPGARKVIQVDTVDGVATVADPEALQRMLVDGVGRARAYGCGLLTVKRI